MAVRHDLAGSMQIGSKLAAVRRVKRTMRCRVYPRRFNSMLTICSETRSHRPVTRHFYFGCSPSVLECPIRSTPSSKN